MSAKAGIDEVFFVYYLVSEAFTLFEGHFDSFQYDKGSEVFWLRSSFTTSFVFSYFFFFPFLFVLGVLEHSVVVV